MNFFFNCQWIRVGGSLESRYLTLLWRIKSHWVVVIIVCRPTFPPKFTFRNFFMLGYIRLKLFLINKTNPHELFSIIYWLIPLIITENLQHKLLTMMITLKILGRKMDYYMLQISYLWNQWYGIRSIVRPTVERKVSLIGSFNSEKICSTLVAVCILSLLFPTLPLFIIGLCGWLLIQLSPHFLSCRVVLKGSI